MTQSPFDQQFLDQQKKKLHAQKDRLEKELRARGTAKKTDANDYVAAYQEYGDDVESNAAEYAQTETNASVIDELERSLAAADAALARLEDGTYGIDETGVQIKKERLEANPAATGDI